MIASLSWWHHGRGRGTDYCDGCRAAGAACATTQPSLCQYNASAPRSEEGRAAWAAFQEESWRVKVGGMGVIVGIDTSIAHRQLVRAGVDAMLADTLLGAAERGCIAALNEREGESDEQN